MNIINSPTTFSLTAEAQVMVAIGANVYTYQITGTGTATIQGSNDGVNWFDIGTALAAPTSLCVIHSWKYLKKSGTADVLVSRA